jgi:uncharacterized protein YggE
MVRKLKEMKMKIAKIFSTLLFVLALSGCSGLPVLGGSFARLGGHQAAQPSSAVNQVDPAAEQRSVTVTGSSQVLVIPDEVVLTLGVETADLQLANAQKTNDEIVKRVFQVASDMQIDSKYVQTDFINIEPRYQDSYTEKHFIGYFVRKSIVITLKDLTKFEELYSRVLEAGVNYVHGIDFQTSELRKYRDQARALAIQAAQQKAVALAGELAQEVGEPVLIQENSDYWWSGYSSWWGSSGAGMYQNVIQNSGQAPVDTEGTLAPGQIAVTANVTVEFDLK